MSWTVLFHDAFDAEFLALDEGLQDELLADERLDEHLASLATAKGKERKHGKKT